jgi:lipid II:glycine glycyltransferase (peptidoglycan interpeptide bridge formation enzyme)
LGRCIWVGATQANLKGLYPVDLLQWKIIEWGHENGFKHCEILGANMPSISYFKSRYNFDLNIYYSVEKSSNKYKLVTNGYRVAANVYKSVRHPKSRLDKSNEV